jgi:hypothetical protein
MIYEALLAPHENPVSLRDIKRALLTYDKVILVDPGDRDLIPPNALMPAMFERFGLPPIISHSSGPVRPMPKGLGYDVRFERILVDCKVATNQGLVKVISTYSPQETNAFTIGAVPLGGYPLNPTFVYWSYRAMAGDNEYLRSALARDSNIAAHVTTDYEGLTQGAGDGSINDIRALPLMGNEALSQDVREAVTYVARSRLGAFIKYAGYCEQKNLVPVFPNIAYGGIADRLFRQVRAVLPEAEDTDLLRAGKVLQLCHEEFLDEQALDQMEVKDVLALRTSAWGQQAEARERLFGHIFEIARASAKEADFSKHAKKAIADYRQRSEALVLERKNLLFKVKCELGSGALTAATAAGSSVAGLLAQLSSPTASIGLTIAAAVWALSRTKNYVPQFRELAMKEKEWKRGAAFALQDFYSRIR